MAGEVSKIVSNISPQYISDLINIKVSQYDFRNDLQADLIHYGLKPFRYKAARI